MPTLSNNAPQAVILGCSGLELLGYEAEFFRDTNPLGFILFGRNCETPDQIRELVARLKDSVGRDAPVLIDQEGGRVQRLIPPHWRKAPPAETFVNLANKLENVGVEAACLNARLMAEELKALGVTVNCTPVLDIPQPGAHSVIGDRAHGGAPDQVTQLGRAVCDGTLGAGVLPVIKHIPGHGRSKVDSHHDLPVVDASYEQLDKVDFAPFRNLKDMPLAMTAHIVYTALDPDVVATLSRPVIENTIRSTIGFDGLLLSDDLSMEALGGTYRERAEKALAAGCDVILHCNGKMLEMTEVVKGCRPMDSQAIRRYNDAEIRRLESIDNDFDKVDALAKLSSMLAG